MATDRDIWLVAKQGPNRHGDDAEMQVAMRADALLDKGDMEGRGVWLRVLEAIEALRNTMATGLSH